MAPSIIHLPNGHKITVTPVFGGLSFKPSELSNTRSAFPPGWTIVIHAEDDDEDEQLDGNASSHSSPNRDKEHYNVGELGSRRKHHVHRFQQPSLRHDHLFISSISNPASNEFKPPVSPTRQIAMMLWATLWWYFHQPQPNVQLDTPACANTCHDGRPRGDWKVHIKKEGIFKGKHLLQKLERMGLIVSEDSSVGLDLDDLGPSSIYITRRHFWQLDPRIYLFTLPPAINSPWTPGSPNHSRPSSPNRSAVFRESGISGSMTPPFGTSQTPWSTTDPYHSSSHLPTYFPPAPAHYTWTGNVRHPHRAKAPRQGEIIYTRYIPSLGETLSFRIATLSRKSNLLLSPALRSSTPPPVSTLKPTPASASDPNIATLSPGQSDVELLHKWMNDPRVAHSWGEAGPIDHQQSFLESKLRDPHLFPVIASFDGRPFGYFEIYWVKEDGLGHHIQAGDFDRGFHLLVGEQDFRGPHRVPVWLSALVHYCWLADQRTNVVVLEPRVDNVKLRRYCEDIGFFKEREITFAHKQSNLMKMHRDTWEAPVL